MATSMTFDSLKQDVQRYLERGNSLATDPYVYEQIPSLINNAERRCATELKIEGFINVVNTTLVAGQSVYAKPDRWKRTVSIQIGAGAGYNTSTPVFPRAYEYLRVFWPDATQMGQPVFYAEYDYNHWLISPTPDDAYPTEIIFYQQPPLLDEGNQTNWLTDYAPRLLLYATLLETEPFLKNDERIAVWQGFYDREAGMLNGEDISKILDRSAARKEV